MSNIKEFLLNSKKRKEIQLDGFSVFINKWTGRERANILPKIMDTQNEDTQDIKVIYGKMALVLVECLLDYEGNRVFEDGEKDLLLDNIDGELLDNLFKEILDFNNLTEKAVPDAAKN
jgi:hypothetical protein